MELEADLSLFSRLRFVTRKRRRGGTWGERRSTRRGQGLEFADYRDYALGDDPRRVDWNLYARLDRPYVRLYEEEEDLAVSILVDGSASMAWEPVDADRTSVNRWLVAQKLVIALGTIALAGGDALTAALLNGHPDASWGPARGRVQLSRWRSWGEHLRPASDVQIAPALEGFAAHAGRPALVLLITDGYDPSGLAAGIAALAGRRHEIVLLHLLLPEEVEPSLRGDLRLVDSESGEKLEVTVDNAVLSAYTRRFESWTAELRTLAGKHGGRYAMLRADVPLRKLLLDDLRQANVLR